MATASAPDPAPYPACATAHALALAATPGMDLPACDQNKTIKPFWFRLGDPLALIYVRRIFGYFNQFSYPPLSNPPQYFKDPELRS